MTYDQAVAVAKQAMHVGLRVSISADDRDEGNFYTEFSFRSGPRGSWQFSEALDLVPMRSEVRR